MLDNSIRGGQIFIHQIRMFKQIAGYAGLIACVLGFTIAAYLNVERFENIEWHPALTYWRGFVIDKFDDVVPSFGPINKQMMINVANLGKAHLIPIKEFMQTGYFIRHGDRLLQLLIIFLLYGTGISFSVFLLIFWGWGRFGKFAKERKHLKGSQVKTAKEVASFLKSKKIASIFHIGDVPLVKNSEVKHILITGSTESGKTNCLHLLLPQIREQKQPAIVLDTEGDMVSRYYRPGKDIIINPFDLRAHNWDFWDEVQSARCIKKIATSFFPDSPPDIHDYDKKWTEWGRMLFIGCVEYLKNEGQPTIENLYNLIHKETIEDLTKKLRDTSVGSLLHTKSDNNVAPHNIRINTLLATEWLEFLSDDKEKSFSFREWFSTLDVNGDDRWIFVTCDGGDAKILLPFFSVIMDIALNSLISLGIKEDRRVWFIFDELAKLKYLPTLQENITILRKYGGCILAATQSFNQIFAHYGRNSGNVMLGQFNTNIIFKIKDIDEAAIITKRIGEIEYLSHQKNTSYGAHEFRDGISYNEQEKKQDLIKPSDLANLEVHQAYILLPEPAVAISQTKLGIANKPKYLQPAFVNNPKIELMIEEREQRWKNINKSRAPQVEINKSKEAKTKVKSEQNNVAETLIAKKLIDNLE